MDRNLAYWGHGTVVFVGTDEGGQVGDGRMTRVKRGGHDWRNICRRTQETMTAAHEELSPMAIRKWTICKPDQLCFHFLFIWKFGCICVLYSKVLEPEFYVSREKPLFHRDL